MPMPGTPPGVSAPAAPVAGLPQEGLRASAKLQLLGVAKTLGKLVATFEPGSPEQKAVVSALKALTPVVGSSSEGLTESEHLAMKPAGAGPGPQGAPGQPPQQGGGMPMAGPAMSMPMGRGM